MATPEGSGSHRTPTQQATASSPTERSGAGGGQLGVLQSTAAQPSYHAYDGLEKELLSNANAQAFGVDTAAPPTWTDSTHLQQMQLLQNQLAQLQLAHDAQAVAARDRENELARVRSQQYGQHQEFQAAYNLQQQQSAYMLHQQRIAADQAAADQLQAQQLHAEEVQRRIESERLQFSLDQRQQHDAFVAREQSLRDQEVAVHQRGGQNMADAKRHEAYVADLESRAAVLFLKETHLREQEVAFQAKKAAEERARALALEGVGVPPARPEVYSTPDSGKGSALGNLHRAADPQTAGQTAQAAAATAPSQAVVAKPGADEAVSALDKLRSLSGLPHGTPLTMAFGPLAQLPSSPHGQANIMGLHGLGATPGLAAQPQAHTPPRPATTQGLPLLPFTMAASPARDSAGSLALSVSNAGGSSMASWIAPTTQRSTIPASSAGSLLGGASIFSGIHASAFTAPDAIPEASPPPSTPANDRVATDKETDSKKDNKKFKEADDLLGLPSLPSAAMLHKWKFAISNYIKDRSDSPNIIFKWIADVSKPEIKLDDLHWSKGPPELECLDNKLANALYSLIHGELKRVIDKTNLDLFKHQQCLSGRQILWMYYNSQKVDDVHVDRYWWKRFENLKIRGTDNQALQNYLDQWDYHLEMLPESYLPAEDIMELRFRTNVKQVKSFSAETLHFFDRFMCNWTPTKSSYALLRQMCENHLAQYLKEKTIKRWTPDDTDHHANEFVSESTWYPPDKSFRQRSTSQRIREVSNRDSYDRSNSRHRREYSRGRGSDAIIPRAASGYGRSNSRGSRSASAQPKREPGDCRAWMRGGRCINGNRCEYKHDPRKAGTNKGKGPRREKGKPPRRPDQRNPFIPMRSRFRPLSRNSSQRSRWSSTSSHGVMLISLHDVVLMQLRLQRQVS